MSKKTFYLYAESQIHAGKGTDVGVVDLPIQRERTTDFPIIQGVKGSLRASKLINDELFGSKPNDSNKGESIPGKVAFSEAKILLFPVRSVESLFVWVTCPIVLNRFKNSSGVKFDIPEIKEDNRCFSTNEKDQLHLEELEIKNEKNKKVDSIEKELEKIDLYKRMKGNLIIVSDNMFTKIVKSMTEVIPRIKIGPKGVVETGALWYEEYLPQDTVMYFTVRETVYSEEGTINNVKLDDKAIYIGGKETVGKGFALIKEV